MYLALHTLYPIWRLEIPGTTTGRNAFWADQYEVSLGTTDGDGSVVGSFPMLENLVPSLWTSKEDEVVQDVPYPKNAQGQNLPYSSRVDFDTFRVDQIPGSMLLAFLQCYQIYVPAKCPLSPAKFQALRQEEQDRFEMCVWDRVEEVRLNLGRFDPVRLEVMEQCVCGEMPWTWKSDVAEVSLSGNTLEFLETVSTLNLPTDDYLHTFNLGEENHLRALRLLGGGNSYVEEMRLLEGTLLQCDAEDTDRDVIWVQMPALASMKSKRYNVLAAFKKSTLTCILSPYSHCSCPGGCHLCSHVLDILALLRCLKLLLEVIRKVEWSTECLWSRKIKE